MLLQKHNIMIIKSFRNKLKPTNAWIMGVARAYTKSSYI